MERYMGAMAAAGLLVGCSGIPEVQQVDALDGDQVVASIADGVPNDAVFEDDLPVSVSFEITFDETMSITSAEKNIWIEGEDGGQLDVSIDGRLSVLTVVPDALLAPEENHTLVLKGGLQDNSGNSLITGYRMAFYTAPAM